MYTSASTSTNPYPSVEEIEEYDMEQIVTFLQKNLKINKNNFAILREQEVCGLAFLDLTEQKLLNPPFSLHGSPALDIAELVEKLNNQSRFYHKIV
jgi:hypothetical protein